MRKVSKNTITYNNINIPACSCSYDPYSYQYGSYYCVYRSSSYYDPYPWFTVTVWQYTLLQQQSFLLYVYLLKLSSRNNDFVQNNIIRIQFDQSRNSISGLDNEAEKGLGIVFELSGFDRRRAGGGGVVARKSNSYLHCKYI